MARTGLTEVEDQIQQFWSPLFMDELKEDTLLPALLNRDYDGDIKKGGDTVKVSQIDRPAASNKEIGVDDAAVFDSTALSTQQVEVKADRRIIASYEIDDLAMLQSQIGEKDSEIRRGLLEAVEIELNTYLYSLASPSTSAPDHLLSSEATMDAALVAQIRKLGSQAKWNRMKPWYLMADPGYYEDILNDSTLTSSDFTNDQLVVGGQKAITRYGINILEDNSAGLLGAPGGADTEDVALAFHPDYQYLVMQRQPTFKLSDLHSNKQFGFLLSVDMIVGSKIGIDGDVKHILIKASA